MVKVVPDEGNLMRDEGVPEALVENLNEIGIEIGIGIEIEIEIEIDPNDLVVIEVDLEPDRLIRRAGIRIDIGVVNDTKIRRRVIKNGSERGRTRGIRRIQTKTIRIEAKSEVAKRKKKNTNRMTQIHRKRGSVMVSKKKRNPQAALVK